MPAKAKRPPLSRGGREREGILAALEGVARGAGLGGGSPTGLRQAGCPLSLAVGIVEEKWSRGGVAVGGEPERSDPTGVQIKRIWGTALELHGC